MTTLTFSINFDLSIWVKHDKRIMDIVTYPSMVRRMWWWTWLEYIIPFICVKCYPGDVLGNSTFTKQTDHNCPYSFPGNRAELQVLFSIAFVECKGTPLHSDKAKWCNNALNRIMCIIHHSSLSIIRALQVNKLVTTKRYPRIKL